MSPAIAVFQAWYQRPDGECTQATLAKDSQSDCAQTVRTFLMIFQINIL